MAAVCSLARTHPAWMFTKGEQQYHHIIKKSVSMQLCMSHFTYDTFQVRAMRLRGHLVPCEIACDSRNNASKNIARRPRIAICVMGEIYTQVYHRSQTTKHFATG